jgi:hypothetical protein
VIPDKRRNLQADTNRLKENHQKRNRSRKWISAVSLLIMVTAGIPAILGAQQSDVKSPRQARPVVNAKPVQPPEAAHRFFDKTNLMLFAGVAAVRALDFTSTEHFRELGNKEVLLTNSIVDNKPLFAGIEVAGTAISIGAAYWLHRTGHHKLERWISIVHIGVGTFGDAHNYSLGPAR